ncbi:hypothetical protein H3S88_10470 [Gilliamella sp. B14448G11]|uniref:glycosyltransferase n=1 Tax=unclassified Gilliamella TaxID=2685620 RepID=UPI0018DD7043|nr:MULTISPECIES: glycosyltransferase [unclassified Gilliamella]MBI0028369.1 hypothetical protein [Gilliamella sp. B14448G7]MBI0030534.1 hypothetical protein [Gilliamella sp. B14384G15]MBI0036088.1 hypothetical protein [Gilliamella sp. B14448G11]MBI0042822.1 hypothetical protein [Gilliamella sp. B14448G12]MBI0057830.1 hypothetical protein [Gilliamella sp. B14384G12]
MKKQAVFIAGDENIYFPALVALESINEHNEGIFDLFMCFDGSKLTPSMQQTLNKYSINFVDTKELSKFGIEEKFSTMIENHWPIDIFYNYALPIYLGELGYTYSYKVDYDILCVGKYILDEIEPCDVFFSGWSNKVDLEKENIEKETIKKLIDENIISGQSIDYMNVGFLGFNNKIYTEQNFFEKLSEVYQLLKRESPNAKLLEQIAFALVIESTKGKFKKIPETYNHRVLSTRESDDNFEFDTKNIHFITKFKPWKKLEKNIIKWSIFNNGSHIYLYRNLWLDYASKIEGFEIFCMEKPLTVKQLVGMEMHVVRCFNEKVNSLKNFN